MVKWSNRSIEKFRNEIESSTLRDEISGIGKQIKSQEDVYPCTPLHIPRAATSKGIYTRTIIPDKYLGRPLLGQLPKNKYLKTTFVRTTTTRMIALPSYKFSTTIIITINTTDWFVRISGKGKISPFCTCMQNIDIFMHEQCVRN